MNQFTILHSTSIYMRLFFLFDLQACLTLGLSILEGVQLKCQQGSMLRVEALLESC